MVKGEFTIRIHQLAGLSLMVLLLLVSLCLETEGAEQEKVSLAWLRDRVITNNADLAIAKVDVEIAERNLQMARAEQLRRADPVQLKLAEVELAAAVQAVEVLKQELNLQAEEAYFLLVKIEQQKELAAQTKEYMLARLESISAQFREGLATKQDLAHIQLGITEIEHQLQSLHQEWELAKVRLLTLMGLPYDYELGELAAAAYDFTYVELDVEIDLMDLLINNNPELRHLSLELELAQMQFQLSHPEYTPELIRELSYSRYERQKLIYEKRAGQLYLQALECQHQLYQLEAYYLELQQRAAIAAANLAAVERRYQEGLELTAAVVEAEIELHRIKTQLLSTLFAHYAAKARFGNLTGLSVGVEE